MHTDHVQIECKISCTKLCQLLCNPTFIVSRHVVVSKALYLQSTNEFNVIIYLNWCPMICVQGHCKATAVTTENQLFKRRCVFNRGRTSYFDPIKLKKLPVISLRKGTRQIPTINTKLATTNLSHTNIAKRIIITQIKKL